MIDGLRKVVKDMLEQNMLPESMSIEQDVENLAKKKLKGLTHGNFSNFFIVWATVNLSLSAEEKTARAEEYLEALTQACEKLFGDHAVMKSYLTQTKDRVSNYLRNHT